MSKPKTEKEILKVARKKQLESYTLENPNKINKWLLIRSNWSQKVVEWYSQSPKRKYCQPRILYPVKLSCKNESKVNTFLGNQNLLLADLS